MDANRKRGACMRYHFKYRNGVKEMWELAMIYQYSSLVGVVNVVFGCRRY